MLAENSEFLDLCGDGELLRRDNVSPWTERPPGREPYSLEGDDAELLLRGMDDEYLSLVLLGPRSPP